MTQAHETTTKSNKLTNFYIEESHEKFT